MVTKLSPNGLNFIKTEEGLARVVGSLVFPYNDIAGNPTIGYGHRIKPGEDFSQGIDEERCSQILLDDVLIAESAVCVLAPGINQNQFDALVDFTFNAGAGNLHRMLSHGINNVPQHILLYSEAGGVESKGLGKRRQAELDLWNTPVADQNSSVSSVS